MSWPDHSFNVEHAKEYGVDVAIAIHSFQLWIIRTRANRKHLHDGHTWIYNTREAFCEWWPYWKPDKIRRILEQMSGPLGILLKGNFAVDEGRSPWERTCWYAFADEARFLPAQLTSYPTEEPIGQFRPMHLADSPNRVGKIAQ